MACDLMVPDGTRLLIAPYADFYANVVPDPEVGGSSWRDMGCLAQFSTTTNVQQNKVFCMGSTEPIAVLRGQKEGTISFGLKCLDPRNFATAFGGGEYVADPSLRPDWFQFRQNSGAAPMVSLVFDYTNTTEVDNAGTLMRPQYEMVWPKAQLSSGGEFNGGPEGGGEEVVLPLTFEILKPDADATHNPGALSFLHNTNHPEAQTLVGSSLI